MAEKRKRPMRLPGKVRVTLQLYDADTRSYFHIPGLSESGIDVANAEELERFYAKILGVARGRRWAGVGAPAPETVPGM